MRFGYNKEEEGGRIRGKKREGWKSHHKWNKEKKGGKLQEQCEGLRTPPRDLPTCTQGIFHG